MSVNDQLQRAYQLIRAGSRQDAVQVLMPVLRADPANADAWWLLANAVTDPNQKKRALEEVLKLRPNDDRARKMLDQIAPPPPPPPPAADPFDMDDDAFNSPSAVTPPSTATVMPNWSSSTDTPATVSGSPSPIGADPFGSSSDPFGNTGSGSTDPFGGSTGASKAKNDAPPTYAPPAPMGYPPTNVPPAPVYMGPPPRKGPSCCLIFSCLFILLICVAPTLCVGAGFAGLSPVFNQIAVTLGARDFQSLPNVFSGQATPLPGSAIGDVLNQMGVENMGQLQSTLEGFATFVGTPGMSETLGAVFGLPSIGSALEGATNNKGSIEQGQTVSGNVAPGTVGDAWIISLNSGDTIVANAVGVGGTDTTLIIVDSANRVVDSNDDGPSGTDAQLTFTAPSDGKYTLIVSTFGGVGGEYQLSVQGQ